MATYTFHNSSFQNSDPSTHHNWRSTLTHLWQTTLHWLVGEDELKIWQTCDKKGQITWHIYDPFTNDRECFAEEAEVRVWLETRHTR